KDINNGDYIKVRSVNFGKGAKSFEANAASGSNGGTISIRLDNPEGKLAGTCKITHTGGWQSWKVLQAKFEKINGIHDVYFVFNGGEGNLFNFDSWKFNKK
ncbi:MAG TPA: carbohydrate-binding protein, partial [Bacteroidales bacterium]|nr:carbohydrate-binding protein [Bacteroidales bacterium]